MNASRFLNAVLLHYASIATGGYTRQELPEELRPYKARLTSTFHALRGEGTGNPDIIERKVL